MIRQVCTGRIAGFKVIMLVVKGKKEEGGAVDVKLTWPKRSLWQCGRKGQRVELRTEALTSEWQLVLPQSL